MSSLYIFGVVISTIVLSLTLTFQFLKNPKNPSNPPGTTGWPLIGESLIFLSNPKKFVLDRMAKHSSSEIFTTSLAGEKMAVFCGAMANKCIFSNEGVLFEYWIPPSAVAILGNPKLNYETKTGKPPNDFMYAFLKPQFIQRYVSIVDTMAQQHLNTHWVSRDMVKVHELVREFLLATSLRVFINYAGLSSNEVKELEDPLRLMLKGLYSIPINLPGTAYNKALRGSKLLMEKLVNIIRQRKLTLCNQNLEDEFLGGIIMNCAKNGHDLSNEEIANRVIALIFGSVIPTGTTLTFTIAYLAEYPEIYEMVLQEQQDIANSKQAEEPLTWMDVQKMQYSWNVISETLRLKSPGTASFRTVLTDFTYSGFKFLKGSKVHWTQHSTNTDPKYFSDPETFDPQRFEKNAPAPAPFAFVPFGSGPRMCAGKDFARALTLVFLHHAVTRFRFERVNPNEKITFNPDPVPAEGLPIYLSTHVK